MKAPRGEGGVARAHLEILRVFLLPSAVADSHAGLFAAALARGNTPGPGPAELATAELATVAPATVALAAVASVCAYAFGLVLNDVLDARKDRARAPHRPIPSGRISPGAAVLLGSVLAAAALAAGAAGGATPVVASVLALALLYDAGAKRIPVVGDAIMGLCRGGNFLLGAWMAVGSAAGSDPWILAGGATLAIYVASVTSVSRLEDTEPAPGPPRSVSRPTGPVVAGPVVDGPVARSPTVPLPAPLASPLAGSPTVPLSTPPSGPLAVRAAPALLVPAALVAARPGDPLVWANALALAAILATALAKARRGRVGEPDARRRTAALVGGALGAIYLVDAGLLLALAPPTPDRILPLGVIVGLFALAAAWRRAWVRRGGEPS